MFGISLSPVRKKKCCPNLLLTKHIEDTDTHTDGQSQKLHRFSTSVVAAVAAAREGAII